MRQRHTITGKSASEISAVIDEHIVGRMAFRNRDIMKCRYIDGMTYEKIAEKFELSTQRTKDICYRLLDDIAPFI